MHCAGVSYAALAVVALLAYSDAMMAIAIASGCEEQLPAAVDHTSCLKLANTSNLPVQRHESCVSVGGRPVSVTLYWGSGPARAAAALLHALLRHVLRYRRVRLAFGSHRTTHLARQVPFHPSANYNDLVIALSTAWEPEEPFPWSPREWKSASLAGPRLTEFGSSSIPARCRLHARLSQAARLNTVCQQYTRWTFYTNATALALCDFFETALHSDNVSTAEVIAVSDCETSMRRLQARAATAPVRARNSSRAELLAALRTAKRSVLFIDYDIWLDEPSVSVVESPPCVFVAANCTPELDSANAMRVADVNLLQTYAPRLFKLVYDFKMTTKSLREILDREANGEHIDEAACKWGLYHQSQFSELEYFKLYDYNIMVYICYNPDTQIYIEIIRELETYINTKTSHLGFATNVTTSVINCLDENQMSKELASRTKFGTIYSLLGAVSQAVAGAAEASTEAAVRRIPLLLADAVPDDAEPEHAAPQHAPGSRGAATWRVAGRPRHVTLALQYFVRSSNWSRVAVLSEPTALAKHYYAMLGNSADFTLGDFKIPLDLTEERAMEAVRELEITNSRIVFVNANSDSAAVILTAALKRRMSYADGFVWIVRDWRPNNATSNITHFTISLWSRGEERGVLSEHAELRSRLGHLLSGRQWPPHTVSLADAILTLTYGYKVVFQKHHEARHDLHTKKLIRLLNKSLSETPVAGLYQHLHYKERSLEETFVYVDEWRGERFKRLATWRVNASSGAVLGEYQPPARLPRDDGRRRCMAPGGDSFYPDCYDGALAGALLVLMLTSVALLLLHRAHRRDLVRIEHEHWLKTIAQRRDVAIALEPYLIKREMLRLDHELGAGRFGSVRMALLCTPRRAPRHVAAKALRENASASEESEFLREACTIASLDHAHIVRLVGVCITDGPPLVLMELALFGDLLGYLRARRHLAESASMEALSVSDETTHVSAEALTRLALEAAMALQYLEESGVVHRDVRAANCLVDARRSLKLADFGMARRTQAGADGAAEYACRRRGLFPVLWMAPESLAHGVFSPASDVWAFGVLLVELVTLGARPYGTMSPLRVLEYVAAGGRPPLPLDVSSDTRWLAQQCWQRAAECRPSAAALVAYLASQPSALSAALLPERDDADSGFGESPSTELLPPDSPGHSLDQLQVLAATH